MCAAANLRAIDPNHVRLVRNPGFGSYINFLKWARSTLRGSSQQHHVVSDRILELITATLDAVARGNGAETQFSTLVKLRNHLAHGGPFPPGEEAALTARAAQTCTEISSAIGRFLDNSRAQVSSGEDGLHRLTLAWPAGELCLWPFICADAAGNWCVYSGYVGNSPFYLRRDAHDVRVEGRGENLLLALSEALVARSDDQTLPDFIGGLRDDLEGFRDPDTEPYHHENEGVVNMLWMRATSGEPEERSDRCRLGQDDRREWDQEPGLWVPYTA